MKNVGSVDIGGTNVRIAVLDESGNFLFRESFVTKGGGESLIKSINNSVLKMRQKYAISAVGVGVPGLVNYSLQSIVFCPNLEADFSLLSFQLPTFFLNDADAALYGEMVLSKRFNENFAVLTIGTGMGGSFRVSTLMPDQYMLAGEIGHMKVVANGRKCGCGANGCLEAYVSATAVIDRARSIIDKRIETAESIFKMSAGGNELALEIVDEMAFFLGIGISNMVNILGIDKYILAGQVSKSADQFIDKVISSARKNIYQSSVRNLEVIKSANIDDIALVGAAEFARKKLDEK